MYVFCRSEAVLPMLTFVQKRGNATFYEWRTGKTPTVVERPVVEEAPAAAITEDTVGTTVTRNQNARKAQINVLMCPFITVLHLIIFCNVLKFRLTGVTLAKVLGTKIFLLLLRWRME